MLPFEHLAAFCVSYLLVLVKMSFIRKLCLAVAANLALLVFLLSLEQV